MIKGENVKIINLINKKNFICDYFVICDGKSKNQVYSIYQNVEKIVKRKIYKIPYNIEGSKNKEWILVDYTTIVVHIFQKKIRSYYDIEKIWE